MTLLFTNEEFYGHRFSCRKNAFFQAPIKLAQPSPAPELQAKKFTDTKRIFLTYRFSDSEKSRNSGLVPVRESFCESGEGVRLPRERGRPPRKSGELPRKSGELPAKSGKPPGNVWIAVKFHSERTSGKFGELPGQNNIGTSPPPKPKTHPPS